MNGSVTVNGEMVVACSRAHLKIFAWMEGLRKMLEKLRSRQSVSGTRVKLTQVGPHVGL
jgi:hypothetical protein